MPTTTISLLPSRQRAVLRKLHPDIDAVVTQAELNWDLFQPHDAPGLLDRSASSLDLSCSLLENTRTQGRELTEDESLCCDALQAVSSRFKQKAEALRQADSSPEPPPRSTTPDPLPTAATPKPSRGFDKHFGLAPSQSVRGSLSGRDLVDDGLSFGGLVRAMTAGPRNAAEKRALAEGADGSGGVTVPAVLLAEFIDRLRSQVVCIQAGARTVALTSDTNTLARLETDPAVAWRLENASVAESDPTFAGVTFTPRWCGCIVRCSRELLEDSINIDQMLTQAFAASLAVEVDRVALVGTGTPPQPRGILNTAGIGNVPVTAALSYGNLLTALGVIAAANGGPSTACIVSPSNFYKLAALIGTDGHFLVAPPAVPPILMTSSMTNATAIVGNFSELIFGVRSVVRIELLREAYAANHQFGYLAWLRYDVGLAHAASFCSITGIV
jgi:HK97 family phage major capsid protein